MARNWRERGASTEQRLERTRANLVRELKKETAPASNTKMLGYLVGAGVVTAGVVAAIDSNGFDGGLEQGAHVVGQGFEAAGNAYGDALQGGTAEKAISSGITVVLAGLVLAALVALVSKFADRLNNGSKAEQLQTKIDNIDIELAQIRRGPEEGQQRAARPGMAADTD